MRIQCAENPSWSNCHFCYLDHQHLDRWALAPIDARLYCLTCCEICLSPNEGLDGNAVAQPPACLPARADRFTQNSFAARGHRDLPLKARLRLWHGKAVSRCGVSRPRSGSFRKPSRRSQKRRLTRKIDLSKRTTAVNSIVRQGNVAGPGGKR